MKRIMTLLLALFFSVNLCIPCLADAGKDECKTGMFDDGSQVTWEGERIPDLIARVLDTERILDLISNQAEKEYIDNTRISPDIYLIAYDLGRGSGFYDLLKEERTLSFDFDSFKDSSFGNPVVLVPVWGEVEGKTHIIGYVRIYYDFTIEEYTSTPILIGIEHPLEDFFTMDKISTFCEKHNVTDIKNVVLANNGYQLEEAWILLIETSDEIYVLDIWDTIRSGEIEYPGYDLEKEKLYPFEEYYEKYFELQKELGNEGHFRWALAPIYGTQPKNYNWIYITVGASVTVVVGVSVLVFVIAVKKKKKAKVDALPENFIE